MSGSVDLVNLAPRIVPGSVTLNLPDVRIAGSVEQENGPGQPNTVLIDFNNGPLANADGQGTSLWQLFASKSGTPAELQAVLAAIDIQSLAKVFAGVN